MKILLHSYSGYTYFLREVIIAAKEQMLEVEWGLVLYSNSDNLLHEFRTLIGRENVLYLQEKLNDCMDKEIVDLNIMHNFPGTIFECVSTSKVVRGHIPLIKKSRQYQLKIVSNTYRIYKEFLDTQQPDFIFFSIIELYDSMILYYLCRELEITPIIYGHSRNIGLSYFTDSLYEDLPPYALQGDLLNNVKSKAVSFIREFRNTHLPAYEVRYHPSHDEVLDTSFLHEGFFQKAARMLNVKLHNLEPHVADTYSMFHRLRIHFHPLTRRYWNLKGSIKYKFYYDVKYLEELPNKFIYYPVQYTPETSINTPAPYFIDQLRAIDLILSAMPPDYFLLVKEHPAMRGEREIRFYKILKSKANVLLADFSLPSIEVIKKASLTISVTGTSCLEAFLLGKPSLHLGKVFFTDWISRFDSLSNFKKVIKDALDSQEVPLDKIIDLVGRVMSVGSDFILHSPSDPYRDVRLLMNRKNINTFLKSMLDHAELLKSEKKQL